MNWLIIAKQWYNEHGCPYKGEFFLGCNLCHCDETGSKVSQECVNRYCPIPVMSEKIFLFL